MYAYELKAKLNHLTLCGQNIDNELEWIGTNQQWYEVTKDEQLASQSWN